MAKQLTFEGLKKPDLRFGGSLLKNHPKTKRPLESKLPIHLVLRANQGGLLTHANSKFVGQVFTRTATKHGVKIYKFANVGNHIHVALKLTRLHCWAKFIREVTGRIALHMKKTNTQWAWKYRPYTRIVGGWQKAFRTLKDYVHLNWLEAMGFINRTETKTLKDLRAIFADG